MIALARFSDVSGSTEHGVKSAKLLCIMSVEYLGNCFIAFLPRYHDLLVSQVKLSEKSNQIVVTL